VLNDVNLMGHLGQAPDLKQTPGHGAVATFRLATSRVWTDKPSGQRREETEWHDVEVWGGQAEACAKYLSKGRLVHVSGRLKTDRWKDDAGGAHQRTKVVAATVLFLPSGGGAPTPAPAEGNEPG